MVGLRGRVAGTATGRKSSATGGDAQKALPCMLGYALSTLAVVAAAFFLFDDIAVNCHLMDTFCSEVQHATGSSWLGRGLS